MSHNHPQQQQPQQPQQQQFSGNTADAAPGAQSYPQYPHAAGTASAAASAFPFPTVGPHEPSRLGHYAASAKVATGAFGVVHKAVSLASCPVLPPGTDVLVRSTDLSSLPTWLHPAVAAPLATLSRLSHANLTATHDVFVEGGRLHAVTEPSTDCMDAVLASMRARKKAFGEEDVWKFLYFISLGVGAAHAAGVAGLGLSPASVLLSPKGEVKVGSVGARLGVDAYGICTPVNSPRVAALTAEQCQYIHTHNVNSGSGAAAATAAQAATEAEVELCQAKALGVSLSALERVTGGTYISTSSSTDNSLIASDSTAAGDGGCITQMVCIPDNIASVNAPGGDTSNISGFGVVIGSPDMLCYTAPELLSTSAATATAATAAASVPQSVMTDAQQSQISNSSSSSNNSAAAEASVTNSSGSPSAADMFSLGCIVYEMCAQSPPFLPPTLAASTALAALAPAEAEAALLSAAAAAAAGDPNCVHTGVTVCNNNTTPSGANGSGAVTMNMSNGSVATVSTGSVFTVFGPQVLPPNATPGSLTIAHTAHTAHTDASSSASVSLSAAAATGSVNANNSSATPPLSAPPPPASPVAVAVAVAASAPLHPLPPALYSAALSAVVASLLARDPRARPSAAAVAALAKKALGELQHARLKRRRQEARAKTRGEGGGGGGSTASASLSAGVGGGGSAASASATVGSGGAAAAALAHAQALYNINNNNSNSSNAAATGTGRGSFTIGQRQSFSAGPSGPGSGSASGFGSGAGSGSGTAIAAGGTTLPTVSRMSSTGSGSSHGSTSNVNPTIGTISLTTAGTHGGSGAAFEYSNNRPPPSPFHSPLSPLSSRNTSAHGLSHSRSHSNAHAAGGLQMSLGFATGPGTGCGAAVPLSFPPVLASASGVHSGVSGAGAGNSGPSPPPTVSAVHSGLHLSGGGAGGLGTRSRAHSASTTSNFSTSGSGYDSAAAAAGAAGAAGGSTMSPALLPPLTAGGASSMRDSSTLTGSSLASQQMLAGARAGSAGGRGSFSSPQPRPSNSASSGAATFSATAALAQVSAEGGHNPDLEQAPVGRRSRFGSASSTRPTSHHNATNASAGTGNASSSVAASMLGITMHHGDAPAAFTGSSSSTLPVPVPLPMPYSFTNASSEAKSGNHSTGNAPGGADDCEHWGESGILDESTLILHSNNNNNITPVHDGHDGNASSNDNIGAFDVSTLLPDNNNAIAPTTDDEYYSNSANANNDGAGGNGLSSLSGLGGWDDSDISIERLLSKSSGATAGAYEDICVLARGKFSTVHKAREVATGKLVAIKRVQIFEMDAEARRACQNESRLLHSLPEHPNIVRFLGAVLAQSQLFIIMELAEAGDLCGVVDRARASKRHLHECVVWHLFAQIAAALCIMHERRVMHRDLKPANVFLGAARTDVMLGDLGVGRYLSSRTAQAFSLVGTPFYMSPETISSSGYGFESDIWSLGCILYELAALQSPFHDRESNYYSLGRRISQGLLRPLHEVVPASVALEQPELRRPTGLPPSPQGGLYSQPLEQLVASMLSVDLTQRPTAAQVLAWARKAEALCAAAGALEQCLEEFVMQDEESEARLGNHSAGGQSTGFG